VQGNVSFTASDRLCLDGQRLVKNGASNDKGVSDAAYWNTSTQFHTELDSFLLIRQHGIAGQGPTGFTVETKSGEIHYYGDMSAITGNDTMGKPLALAAKSYGNVTETGADAFFNTSAASNVARLWALKAIKDVKGNYIVFKYTEDHALGEHYLSEVHYTGRSGGAAPFARVILNYVDNTKIAVGWQAQSRVAMTKLLDTVNVQLDGAIYRQYRLSYFNTNVLEEKNYLLSIQECADTGNSNCLPATHFDWNRPPAVSTSYVQRCDNEPGSPQYCWQEPVTDNYSPFSSSFVTKGSSINRNDQQLMDMNGDGFVDVVYPSGSNWRVRLGGTTSNWTESCVTPPGEPTQCFPEPAVSNFTTEVTMSSVGVAKKQYAQTIDYDGDGQRDLLVANGIASNWTILTYKQSTSTAQQCEPYPDNNICYPHEVTSAYTSIDIGFKAIGLEGGALVADYNGDGLEDIVFVNGGVFQAYRNKGVNSANTHLGFEHIANIGSISASSSQFGLDIATYTADSKSASGFDVNGDGRTDILIKVTEGVCRLGNGTIITFVEEAECRSEGWTWSETTSWKLYTSNGTSYALAQNVGNYTTIRAVDLNGDGYTDLMYQSGTAWYYRLSNGSTFLAPRSANLTSATNLLGYTYFLDINGDGRTDMLLPTATNSWRIMLSRPTKTHEQVIFEQRGTRSFDSGAAIQFADVNADGKLDLLTSTNDAGWKIYLSNRPYIKDHAVRKITNGWGVASLIEYQSITDKDVYFRQDSTNNLGSDYFSPRAGMYVVSKVSSEVNTNNYVSVGYQYGGLLVHKNGRGMLGFEVLRTTDTQTGVLTETVYKQTWPFTGMPHKTSQSKGAVLMSYAENSFASLTTGFGGLLPYISSATEFSYQLGTDSSQYPLAKTVSSFVYDTYGNLISSTVTQSDIASAANMLVTTNANVFNTTAVYQRYGRLTSSSVSKTLDGNSATTVTRQSAFSYNTDLMLGTETLSPNAPATKVATTHLYDAAGNLTRKQVTAATTATGTANVTRSAITSYDTRFRYVASTTDIVGNITTFTYNGASPNTVSGKITYMDSKDANNQTLRDYFDIIGRKNRGYVKGALTTDNDINAYTYWELCAAVGCPASVTGAYLQIRSEAEGQATQRQFIDKYGGAVGSSVLLLDGTTSVSRNTYDDFGRPSRVYEPGSGAPSSHYSQANYDILGRVSSSTLASGGTSSITYLGLTSVQTDPKAKSTTTVNNYLGQAYEVYDHLNNKLRYTYDAYGNLKTVTAINASGTSSLRTTNHYDTYGRKHQMVDQDKGTWNYTHNAFGELLTQTDAKLQVTTLTYDSVGRLIRRYDPSGAACWEFGSNAASYNKGKLYRSSSYTGNALCNTTTAPLYRETYTYNSRGMVASKLVNTAGHSFSISSTYDTDGRLDLLTYPSWSLNPTTDDIVIKHGYQNGALKQLSNHKTGTVYQNISAINARGQASGISYANGVVESRHYIAQSGWLDTLSINKGGSALHSLDYDYDFVGNVEKRAQGFGVGSNAGFTEVFTYDDLHRVKTRTISNLNNSPGYNALPASLRMNESYNYDHCKIMDRHRQDTPIAILLLTATRATAKVIPAIK
jgi:YD repeat-containing protein